MTTRKQTGRRVRGEGSLYQRSSDNRWCARVELPPAADGKRRYKVVTDKTQTGCLRKLAQLKRDLHDHGDVATSSESVEKWMRYWLESINRSRPRTRAGYRSSIEQYIIPALGKIRLQQLLPADIRKLETFIVTGKGRSPTTALQAYSILAKALTDAEREGRVTRNVARLVDRPRRAVPRTEVLSAAEGAAVLRTVAEDRLGSRWAMALLTGARQGEALGLELDRVDFRAGTIDLSWQLQRIAWRHGCGGTCGRHRGTDCPQRVLDAPHDWENRHIEGGLYFCRPKSRAGWRVIPLVDPLSTILERRAAVAGTEPNPYGLMWTADPKRSKGGGSDRATLPLDGSPIDPSKDNRAWHDVLARANVPDVRLHDARHTAVTLLYTLGAPETVVQDIVGQSTVSVTRAYRHKDPALLQEALTRLSATLMGRLALDA